MSYCHLLNTLPHGCRLVELFEVGHTWIVVVEGIFDRVVLPFVFRGLWDVLGELRDTLVAVLSRWNTRLCW